jgi:hypothetical protein
VAGDLVTVTARVHTLPVGRLWLAGIVAVLVSVAVLPAWAGRSAVQVKIVLKPGSASSASASHAVALPVAAGPAVPVTVSGFLMHKTYCYDAFYYNQCGANWQSPSPYVSIFLVPPRWPGSGSVVELTQAIVAGSLPAFSQDHVYHEILNLTGKTGWSLFAAGSTSGQPVADWSGSSRSTSAALPRAAKAL